jgi:predicted O-methyltransferase YrrM
MHRVCRFGELPVRIVEPRHVDGNVSLLELVIINHLVAERSPTTAFEMGTFDGRTTINLAANAATNGRVYTIDLPRSHLGQTALEIAPHDQLYVDKPMSGIRSRDDSAHAKKIVQLYGDTATFDFSPWYGQVDLVFVDASHAAPYVRNDTEIALKMIGNRNDALIIWHDYNGWPGVTQTLDECYETDPRFTNLISVRGTSLVLLEPHSGRIAETVLPTQEDIELGGAYWERYPDVANDRTYGRNGTLGLVGARLHFEDFGQAEGRVWRTDR